MWTLLCTLALASPEVLRPDPTVEAWGTATHRHIQHVPGGAPQVQPPIVLHHGLRPLGPGRAELVAIGVTPIDPLRWLHPELAFVFELQLAPDGAPVSVTTIHDEVGPLLRGLVEPGVPPIDATSVVRGTCGPLLFLTLLPAEPVEPGDTWAVADADCSYEGSHVACEVRSTWPEPSVVYELDATFRLEVDQRMVRSCTRQAELRRTITTTNGSLTYLTESAERYEASAPRAVGMALATKLLAVGGVGLGLLVVLLWRWRR